MAKNKKLATLLVFVSVALISWKMLTVDKNSNQFQSDDKTQSLAANITRSSTNIALDSGSTQTNQKITIPLEHRRLEVVQKPELFMKGQDTRVEANIQPGQPLLQYRESNITSGVRTDYYTADSHGEIHYLVNSEDKKQGVSLENIDSKQTKIAKIQNSSIEATKTYGLSLSNKRVGNINADHNALNKIPTGDENNQGKLNPMATSGAMGSLKVQGEMLTQGVLQTSKKQ